MQNPTTYSKAVLAGGLLYYTLATPGIFAQEALRHSLTGQQAAAQRRENMLSQDYNLQLGNWRFLATASAGVEYNDNINVSQTNVLSDFIFRPAFNLRSEVALTELNSFSFTLGAGYSKYFEHDQYDRFFLRPGSELSFDLFIGDVLLNFHDRFSYTEDPIARGAVSGVGEFGGFENTVGLQADWDLNQVVLTGGYDHYNFISSTEFSDYLDRSSENFLARAAFPISARVRPGVETTVTLTDYDRNILNDHTAVSGGLFAEFQLNPQFRLEPRAGYVIYTFEQGGLVGNTGDVNSYYVDIEFENQIRERIRHRLDLGREIQSGVNADLLELTYARYRIHWAIIEDLEIETPFFFEHGKERGGSLEDKYDRYSAGIGLTYPIFKKVQGALHYRFIHKNSELPNRDYDQNTVFLNFAYRF